LRRFHGTENSRSFPPLLFPQDLEDNFGVISIFSKICGDIRKSRCITSINATSNTGGKFTAGAVDTGGKSANNVVDTSGEFAAGVRDTGGKFATRGAP
jgi:hypothetical protein